MRGQEPIDYIAQRNQETERLEREYARILAEVRTALMRIGRLEEFERTRGPVTMQPLMRLYELLQWASPQPTVNTPVAQAIAILDGIVVEEKGTDG